MTSPKIIKLLLLTCFMLMAFSVFTLSNNSQATTMTEAPTGFDNQTNGYTGQATFNDNKEAFDAVEGIADGLGPVYNAQSCRECHQAPVSGAGSQVIELRAGHFTGLSFIDHPGGSLIHDRAIHPAMQEKVLDGNEVIAYRLSLSTLGDGFIECIPDSTLIALANSQPGQSLGQISGRVIRVPVLEANGALRVGRFGWKNQHASLLSFSADAYLNEMGITTPLLPEENTSNGKSVAAYDKIPDFEDDGEDLVKFADFMRATKAPDRGPITSSVTAGEKIFNTIGCAICHVPSITTAPPGTVINGGQFTVPPALGNKIIHPYSDFLLHDVGTGDGIVQNGGQATRNELRTPPLWGIRTRSRMMHDGLSPTVEHAILRHEGESLFITTSYRFLSSWQKAQLKAFLGSL